MYISTVPQLLRWAEELHHVITLSDIRLIARDRSNASMFRLIRALVGTGQLVKIKRGIYATKEAELSTIAQRIYPQSYISTGTVLSRKAIIGSIPQKRIQAVKVGAPRVFQSSLGIVEFLSISPKLYFGYTSEQHQNWALPEKAFLDVCYYHYKGKRFSFNPASDVNQEMLSSKVLEKFLARYDRRFVTFFRTKIAA